VRVTRDEALTAAYPRHFGATVTLHLTDGTELRETIPDALGDPENPLPEPDLLAKARMLMASAGLAPSTTDALVGAALALAFGAPAATLNEALPRR
jgi:2-methylcitrate dehydratase PrpD